MLIGEYTHTIDEKKRLAIPAKIRKELGVKAVITRGLDNCLFIYPFKEWQKLVEKLSNLPIGQRDTREFSRLMLAGASEVDLDTLGRILVPDYLRKYAQLKKNVVIAGVYNRLEIWDEAKWDTFKNQSEKEVDNIAERLGGLGV
ncbi:MAG TPA: division/cell wall cluster transcriptional repressor MraZ [Candidatus Portnoybacteria bacterium]|jgi:MraZ protein|nr:division/cell wall cluster transcriptional repressor MraZ [Candidatus Portnoybacteria bacterium]MDD5752129.1 division/cell wall cluster transcriptional repressor MraZ [Candidatus Portnoybacteria bacterium]HNU96919.1 division/cell wall cluster transcriptional repressor MraZ [Candidatus Portnoybacteria bacterium]HOZ16585.1 division/cell wall cluster transcriptional repressor MraZ [Candidatus Portnoybacteria bacterium]HPH52325.1 division/cell wall cluster transcriptional repressor MraZ [Candida